MLLAPFGLIETNLTIYVRTIMPAKYREPMTVEPVPGSYSPSDAPAKGFLEICPYIGLAWAVSPGERTPAPYN